MSARDKLPKGWPDQIQFLKKLQWHPNLPPEIQILCRTGQLPHRIHPETAAAAEDFCRQLVQAESRSLPPNDTPSRRVLIKKITDPAHPACGQCGLFAAANLDPRTHVLDYVGIVNSDSTGASTTSDYIIRLLGDLSVDAEFAGNEARFMNDFRGCPGGPKPNVEFGPYRDSLSGELRMGVWVLNKKIRKGDELLVTYGKGFWKARGLIDLIEEKWVGDYPE
ncbi:uncharacterized protein BJ171DRAFT_517874 [Polychytrium aggregatum]|uniref:uncharacterized protein n=1 Tax=Polychytrium aggregatum TaxID=110093 RepID=UPI0022FF0798|nr:uncharacterized protein BJ171DRAFT_517874 [Polychytrium aggregatum]KAI9199541.1 hypothetical protein BJ171DRAFT_517874 [Polychytrium aggregatum]